MLGRCVDLDRALVGDAAVVLDTGELRWQIRYTVEIRMITPAELRASLAEHRLLAIVRASDPDAAVRAIGVLAGAGVRLVEVSLTSTDALDVIRRAALDERITVGAGTVLDEGQVASVLDSGAQFVVTPALTESVAVAVRAGVPVLAGALTPSEILAAHRSGATAVKLFPASLGGPAYLASVRDPLPDVPLVAVGGVDAPMAVEFLRRGALAVGVGSPLLGRVDTDPDLDAIADRARALLDAVASV